MPSRTRKRSQSASSQGKRGHGPEKTSHELRDSGRRRRESFEGGAQNRDGRDRRHGFRGRRRSEDGDPHQFDNFLSALRGGGRFDEARIRSGHILSEMLHARGRAGKEADSQAGLCSVSEREPDSLETKPVSLPFKPSRSYRRPVSEADGDESARNEAPQPASGRGVKTRGSRLEKTRQVAALSSEGQNALASDLLSAKRQGQVPAEEDALQRWAPAQQQLDEWQQKAFEHLKAGQHVIVDAPTSAGKTRVIEALIDSRLNDGLKLIYTSPVKSLSNDKYREFVERYGKNLVGINTGDFKENLGAPIVLATLETYRNSLLGIEPDMRRKVVVYDEYHYLQDESRGSAWEESIILTPRGSQLVLLSASVPNADDFAEWIATLTGVEAQVVRVSKRPVPLVDVVHTREGWVLAETLRLKEDELEKLSQAYVQSLRRNRRRVRNRQFYQELLGQVIEALELDLGPIVVYAARRAEVENLANALARLCRSNHQGPLADRLHERLTSLSGWEYVPSELKRMVEKFGVAFHHSGMIPPARVAIETLLKEGLLRVCCGTMGISLGVNFAVRSAFIADETRPGEMGEKTYSNSEILQMLGRAGRRGHDRQGFSLWSDLGKYARFRPREREKCISSLKFDPSTVMGIVGRSESYAYLSEFYKKSLFMRGQSDDRVLLVDHDLLSAELFQRTGGLKQNCSRIPEAFQHFEKGKRRSETKCHSCPSREKCHPLLIKARQSPLSQIVMHLEEIGALRNQKLTELGQLARHFPQSGGLLIASWLANREMTGETFGKYVQALASFCAAHFKEIENHYADQEFLLDLRMDTEIEFYYPQDLFPEYYDEVKGHVGDYESPVAFRELNGGAPSVVQAWLSQRISWEKLVAEHSTRFFSAGDCMMVLFRFATYLQSCARLEEWDADIAAKARRMLSVVLREPLDARNRMLMEEIEAEEVPEPAEAQDSDGSLLVAPDE